MASDVKCSCSVHPAINFGSGYSNAVLVWSWGDSLQTKNIL